MDSPLLRTTRPDIVPFALPVADAELALAPVMDVKQVAWPFTRLILGELDQFLDRWLGWFADAVGGTLTMPSTLPEIDPQGSWRRVW
jgi:serine/threonine-protein kinase